MAGKRFQCIGIFKTSDPKYFTLDNTVIFSKTFSEICPVPAKKQKPQRQNISKGMFRNICHNTKQQSTAGRNAKTKRKQKNARRETAYVETTGYWQRNKRIPRRRRS